jgi:hypothetical protein
MSKQVRTASGIDLATALEHARAAVGTVEQVESLKAKLAASIAAIGGTGAAAEAGVRGNGIAHNLHRGAAIGSKTDAFASLAKACVFSAALGAAATAVWFAIPDRATHTRTTPKAPSVHRISPPLDDSHANAPGAAPSLPSASAASNERKQLAETKPLTPADETSPKSNVSPSTNASARNAPTADSDALHTPDAQSGSSPEASGHERDSASVRAARKRTTSTSHSPLTTRGAPTTDTTPTPSEVALISRAQRLLDSQPSAALAALREHELAYPSGMLREEREVLRIDAEWALGLRSTALAHARAFLQRYPRSTQARRLEILLSDHKTEIDTTPTE